MDKLVKKNVDIITELQKNNKLLIQKLELYKVENIKLKFLLNKNESKNTIKSVNDNNTDNNSIKSVNDNNSIKSANENNTNNSDNESIKSNDSVNINNYFDIENKRQNKNLSKFIQKKNNEDLHKITSELIFDNDNDDDYN